MRRPWWVAFLVFGVACVAVSMLFFGKGWKTGEFLYNLGLAVSVFAIVELFLVDFLGRLDERQAEAERRNQELLDETLKAYEQRINQAVTNIDQLLDEKEKWLQETYMENIMDTVFKVRQDIWRLRDKTESYNERVQLKLQDIEKKIEENLDHS